jgi:hypothetical protein
MNDVEKLEEVRKYKLIKKIINIEQKIADFIVIYSQKEVMVNQQI